MHSEDAVFSEDVELKHSVGQELRLSSIEIYSTDMQRLAHQPKYCVEDEGDILEK